MIKYLSFHWHSETTYHPRSINFFPGWLRSSSIQSTYLFSVHRLARSPRCRRRRCSRERKTEEKNHWWLLKTNPLLLTLLSPSHKYLHTHTSSLNASVALSLFSLSLCSFNEIFAKQLSREKINEECRRHSSLIGGKNARASERERIREKEKERERSRSISDYIIDYWLSRESKRESEWKLPTSITSSDKQCINCLSIPTHWNNFHRPLSRLTSPVVELVHRQTMPWPTVLATIRWLPPQLQQPLRPPSHTIIHFPSIIFLLRVLDYLCRCRLTMVHHLLVVPKQQQTSTVSILGKDLCPPFVNQARC